MKKIEIAITDLQRQTITDVIYAYIELHEKHLVYSSCFDADEPIDTDDIGMGTDNFRTDLTIHAKKSFISSIELGWFPKSKTWGVLIAVSGYDNAIRIYNKNKKKANDLFKEINEWWLS